MKRWQTAGIILFACTWAFVFSVTIDSPRVNTFGGDAAGYNAGAVSLVQSGTYAIDGVPTVDREPGESLLLAGIYLVFGIENRIAIFAVQGLLALAAFFFFTNELRRRAGDRAAAICFLLLILFPASWYVIFSAIRESLALSLGLCAAAFLLRFERSRAWRDAIASGALLGMLILTYMAFLLLPLGLAPAVYYLWRVRLPQAAVVVVVPFLFVAAWGARNLVLTGHACLSGCQRPAITWYVRGEQAEKIRGLEAFRCLWSEYISRDWTGRSDACSFNNVKNTQWNRGVRPEELDQDLALGKEGQRKILRHFGSYLWFSVFEVLELHLPYVNERGHRYNVSAAAGTTILYLGVLAGLWTVLRRRDLALLLLIPAYATGVFILTDATPRYLMPVIFVYAMIAGIGYDKLLSRWAKKG